MPTYFRTSLLLLLLAIPTLISCSNKKIITGHSTTNEFTIDGNLSDWPHEQALLESSDQFDFYFTHDERYLYIFTSIKTSFYQNAAENVGFTIYIANDEENPRSFGITYPLGATNAMREIPGLLDDYTDDMEWMKKQSNQKLFQSLKEDVYKKVMLSRKLNKKSSPQRLILPLPEVNAQGIKLAREAQGRKLQLELRLPITSTRTEQFAADPKEEKPLYIGFEINPPEFDLSQEVQNTMNNSYDRRRSRRNRPNSHDMERRLSQQMGQFSQWFRIQIQ